MNIINLSRYSMSNKKIYELIDPENEIVFRFVEGSDRPVFVAKIFENEDGEKDYDGYYLKKEDFLEMANKMIELLK